MPLRGMLRKAAEQGDPEAQFCLGVVYMNGQGVPKDEKRAVEWYRRAAEQGLSEAQLNLGNMYADGRGVAKDEVCAVEWYWKAAEQGSTEAQDSLGIFFEKDRMPDNTINESRLLSHYLAEA